MISLMLVIPLISSAEERKASELDAFHRLHSLFVKWDDGFFGSRGCHERALRASLTELIGGQITTPAGYFPVFPRGQAGRVFDSRHRLYSWLVIHPGRNPGKAFEAPASVRQWRTGQEYSISGKVVRWRLGRDTRGRTVNLWLDEITVSD